MNPAPCPRCNGRMLLDLDGDLSCLNCGHAIVPEIPTWLTPAIDASLRQQDARTKQAATRRARGGAARARRA